MKCDSCHRSIASGVEAQKMICEYQHPDDSRHIYGFMMRDGDLRHAAGQLVRGWHHKCYHIVRKREARGDAVTGRVMPTVPTAYEIATGAGLERIQQLREAVADMQALARQIGKPVGDPFVHEAYLARQHDGPYDHTHVHRLDSYQLLGHLQYAHGWAAGSRQPKLPLDEQHTEMHAQAALARTTAVRNHDPGHAEHEDRDWRDQHVAEL